MNNSFSAEGQAFQYKSVTTSTNVQKTNNVEFQDAVQRYELRRSSRSRQSANQQTNVITTKYVQMDDERKIAELEGSRYSQRVVEKYANTSTINQDVNRQSVKEVMDKYRRGRASQLTTTEVKYEPVQQKEIVFENRNSYDEQQERQIVNYNTITSTRSLSQLNNKFMKRIMSKLKRIAILVINIEDQKEKMMYKLTCWRAIMCLAKYFEILIQIMSETDETIKIFQIVACSLSLSGSLFMILVYYKLGMRQNFALRLIMYLTISDMIFSVSNLAYIQPGSKNLRCILQGFFIQYSQLACFIFCFLLCLCIYWTVIKNRNNLVEYNLIFLLIGFGVPLFIAVIPLFTKSYGTLTYVCGIGDDLQTETNKLTIKLESAFLFYIPLWLLNIIGIYLIVRVSCFMTKLRAQSSNSENSLAKSNDNVQNYAQEYELRMSQRITENMLAYPIIMLCCWSGMTIYAVAKLCDSEIHYLKGIRFIMADCLGLCNSIAYGVNALIIIRLRKLMAQQPTTPMIQLKSGSADSQTTKKQFESFLSIATQND